MSLNSCQKCEHCQKSSKNNLFCMHPDTLKAEVENKIDSINGIPVEYPVWCPLISTEKCPECGDIHEKDTMVPVDKLPKIESFAREIRSKLQKYMNILTDGDPNYLLTEESKFEMILTDGQEEEILKFAEDIMTGKIDEHYDFILIYDDNKPELVIFEMIPKHVRASTIMKVCFPQSIN